MPALTAANLQGGELPSSRRESSRRPVSARAESKAIAPSQPPLTLGCSHTPQLPTPRQTPLSGLHLVGAHPPCSRKGPLLPACGLKCPWRVKREATNSRFCGPWDSDRFLWAIPVPPPRSRTEATQTLWPCQGQTEERRLVLQLATRPRPLKEGCAPAPRSGGARDPTHQASLILHRPKPSCDTRPLARDWFQVWRPSRFVLGQ